MPYNCLLCGRQIAGLGYCDLHNDRSYTQLYSIEEARRAGHERVSSLPIHQIMEEGEVAYENLRSWEHTRQWLLQQDPPGDAFGDVIEAAKSYLKAFD